MGRRPDHLHRYKKMTLGKRGYKVFACQEAHCTHYLPVNMAIGKICQCNRCRNPMLMTKIASELTKPHCPDCTKPRPERADPEIEALSELFIEEDENA